MSMIMHHVCGERSCVPLSVLSPTSSGHAPCWGLAHGSASNESATIYGPRGPSVCTYCSVLCALSVWRASGPPRAQIAIGLWSGCSTPGPAAEHCTSGSAAGVPLDACVPCLELFSWSLDLHLHLGRWSTRGTAVWTLGAARRQGPRPERTGGAMCSYKLKYEM